MKAKLNVVMYFYIILVSLLVLLTGCGVQESQGSNDISLAGCGVEENQGSNDIIETYKSFIRSRTDALDYLIYDIDKDGYTYKDGDFIFASSDYGTGGHVFPIYASYPLGNGVLRYSGGYKGKELIYLCKLSGAKYENAESVYLNDLPTQYYHDAEDFDFEQSSDREEFINHQYYQSENSSPYYEGSLLLAHNAMNDFTAVYEAFGYAADEIPASSQETNIEIDLETLKAFVGKTKRDIPYDVEDKIWGDRKCCETIERINMFESEGSVLFELMNDTIIDAFWISDNVRYEEIEQIIRYVRASSGGIEVDMKEDELLWLDSYDGLVFYVDYHEVPICVGVKQMTD